MIQTIEKINRLSGTIEFGGDKSISHRAVIFSALAEGKSILKNCSNGEDVKSTIYCFRQLGCKIEKKGNELIVNSHGYEKFKKPGSALNAGNSGTTARLLSGILIHQKFETEIIGDDSLSSRPMQRIIEPLTKMGGNLASRENNFLPLKFFPSKNISSQNFTLELGSAQVKSAIILSGLHLNQPTKILETKTSRDHTERMLGLPIIQTENGKVISSSKKFLPDAKEYFIPSDLSSAAFFIVAALLHKNSEVIIKNVSLNPTRTAFIMVLQAMGGEISILNENFSSNEPYGDLLIRSSELKNVRIKKNEIPQLIDEIPILSIAGLFASGVFQIQSAKELRYKESDRIASLVLNFQKLGINIEENEDGFAFEGNQEIRNKNILFESFADHRIAMSFAILSSLLEGGGKINNFECVNISNPNFLNQLIKANGN